MNLGNLNRKQAFLNWLNYLDIKFPGSKLKILARAGVNKYGMAGLGQDIVATKTADDPAWYDQIASAAAAIIPTYLNYKTQSKVLDMQIERAKTGQEPISQDYYQQYAPPPPTIRHEVTTGPLMTDETTQTLLVGGGIALAAFALLMMNR